VRGTETRSRLAGCMLLCGELGAQGAVHGIKRSRSRVKNGGHIARYDRKSIHPTPPTGGAYAAPVLELTSRRNARNSENVLPDVSNRHQTGIRWNRRFKLQPPFVGRTTLLTLLLITAMAHCLNARSLVTAAIVAFVTISRTPCEVDAEQQQSSPVAPQVCHIIDFQSACIHVRHA
jgi:hypothetical protein